MLSIYRGVWFRLAFIWPLTPSYGCSREGFVVAAIVHRSGSQESRAARESGQHSRSKEVPTKAMMGEGSNDRDHSQEGASHRKSWPANLGEGGCLHPRPWVGRISCGSYQTL